MFKVFLKTSREREREIEPLFDNGYQKLTLLSKPSFLSKLSKHNSLSYLFIALFLITLIFPDSVLAAGGMEKAKSLLEKVAEWLRYISIATVTIAILVVGYKVLFGGRTIQECTPIIIGALIIASASEVAQLLMS